MKKTVFDLVLIVCIAAGCIIMTRFSEAAHLDLTKDESHSKWEDAGAGLSKLRTGDLIFRHGRGFISNALMSLGRHEQKFSHAGIVAIEAGETFVYHAIGGEENKSNRLRKDPLRLFCDPTAVHSFGVFRTDLAQDNLERIVSEVNAFYREGLEFDTHFDLETDDKMYCTELIYKVFKKVLGNENYLSLSAFSGKKFIGCDDLYLNEHSRLIYLYQY